jgi:NAD(P)H-hydrate epimerase
MRDVEILPSEDGRPHVRVAPATTLTGRDIDVSIAHDGHFAVAVAVIPELDTTPHPERRPDGFRLPDRPRDGHKGTFGTVVVLAGSQGYTGAAYLTSMGAARSGAGIVRLMVAQSIYPILAEKCTEVVVGPVPEISPGVVGHSALSAVLRGFTGAAAGVIGPGIGRDASTRRLIENLIPKVTVPLVLDADALNLLAEHRTLLPKLPAQVVLTPHPAEFGRLANLETAAVQKDRRAVASRFAKLWNKVVVLKGAGTVIAAPDGRITLNPIATPALASGGTGDVLAGLIGGLMAQKLPPFEAAVTGVHLHSVAGMDLEASVGQAGVLASDLLPQIPRVMERLR